MRNGASVLQPPLSDLLRKIILKVFESMHCVKIGKIAAFDAVKRTATVQVVFRRRLTDGTIQDFPDLYDCPVFTLQGGGGALTFPVKAGDECILLFSDNNIDAWYEAGGRALPYDGRRHDISDCIAIVGINSLTNALVPAVVASEVALTYGGAKIAEKNGKITIQNATTNLVTALDTFLTANGAFLTAVAADTNVLAATRTAAGTMQTANTAFKTLVDLLLY